MAPLLLLIAVGSLIAVMVDLAKIAAEGSVSGPELAFWMSLGAGVVLSVAAILGGRRVPLTPHHLFYYAALGFLSIAAPYVASFAVALAAGTNYGIVPFALSPLMTYPLAMLVGLDRAEWSRFLGLFAGFLGTIIVLAEIVLVTASSGFLWALAALSIPVLLASGNIFRALYMPSGTPALSLAAGVMFGAAFWLTPIVAIQGSTVLVGGLSGVAVQVILLQIAVATLHFWLLMRLQMVGGPVYLSQIGYVAAACGVVLGYFLFGELPTWLLLAGIAMIVVGVLLVRPHRTDAR